MNSSGSPGAETRPFGVHLTDMRGAPILAAGLTVTPVARRLAVWWPGGAWVYIWPGSVEFPEGSRIRRLRIIPIQSLAFGALAALGVVAMLGSAALRRRTRHKTSAAEHVVA